MYSTYRTEDHVPLQLKWASQHSRIPQFCSEKCSCCPGGCSKTGMCVKGGGEWECECLPGYFGPNCKYGPSSTDSPGGKPNFQGMCQYMDKYCGQYGDCVSTDKTPSGYKCFCKAGKKGQFCDVDA